MSYTSFRPNSGTTSVTNGLATGPEDYGAFSASEIVAFVDSVRVGTLTSMTYQVHTEKVAQYTFGSPNPRRFVTGKRGIAGAITFNMFDRSALLAIFAGSNGLGKALLGGGPSNSAFSVSPNGITAGIPSVGNTYGLSYAVPATGFPSLGGNATAFAAQTQADVVAAYQNTFTRPLEYTDQLPPFDLTLTMVDNLGKAAFMVVGGLEIVSESGGFSVDDLVTAQAFTFVARYMRPLTPVSATGQPLANAVPSVGGVYAG